MNVNELLMVSSITRSDKREPRTEETRTEETRTEETRTEGD